MPVSTQIACCSRLNVLLSLSLLQDHPYTLFVFSNQEQTDWHFVNVKYDDTDDYERRRLFRRIRISRHEKLRTASERIAMLDLESISPDPEGLSPLDIQKRHEAAFDVEAVTKQFFEDYQSVFHTLQDDLIGQTADKRWAHDYALAVSQPLHVSLLHSAQRLAR